MSLPARNVSRDGLLAQAAALFAEGWRIALVAAIEDGGEDGGEDGIEDGGEDGIEGRADLRVVYTFLRPGEEPTELRVGLARGDAWLPTLAAASYPAGRFEREIRDLYGIEPRGHPLPYRMVRHGHWPTGWYPMLDAASGPPPAFADDVGSYPFLEVGGDGVYEIPVGPVHAGLIEPGHFRFSVVGETILRMKARLWFVHRGVEKLFEGRDVADGIELAERISGDTAVGHALAYAMAVEQAAGIEVAEPDRVVRALLLELERLYNHVADLGAIANDVGFGIANAHAQRLREQLLRHNLHVTGHRLLRGGVSVGAARLREAPDVALVASVAREVAELVEIVLGNPMVADRLTGTAVLPREQGARIGVLGYVARASGIDVDARRDHPFLDLPEAFRVVTRESGDVLARFLVRADEVAVSAEVVGQLSGRLDGGLGADTGSDPGHGAVVAPRGRASGFAVVEAWRGALCHRVELDGAGRLDRVKVVDPSFFNWPALPVALAETIVPDFPLANKSFNQSYAGNDL